MNIHLWGCTLEEPLLDVKIGHIEIIRLKGVCAIMMNLLP